MKGVSVEGLRESAMRNHSGEDAMVSSMTEVLLEVTMGPSMREARC